MAEYDSRTIARFWSKVDRRGADGCWAWTAEIIWNGYGRFWIRKQRVLAHRVSWSLVHGIPPRGTGHHGICVLHRCDNRACVNPKHLFLGTHSDNMADKVSKGRQYRPIGGLHRNSKLDPKTVLEIFMATGTIREIAGRFETSSSNVHGIKQGRRWAHLTGSLPSSPSHTLG